MSEQIVALGSSATTLANALRTPAVRGRWGELQLRRVVEMAGMLQRCDFEEQPGLFSDNGRLRPDLIVHLPGGKQIVVDAKVPLEQFLEAQAAADETLRVARFAGPCASGARPHGPTRREVVLGPAGELAGDGRDVPSGRVTV